MSFILVFCLLLCKLAVTEGLSCSSSNSRDQNKNILLQSSSGVIESPGYPDGYSYEVISQCHWKLVAPEGKMVRLTFLSFQMNDYDIVEIKDPVDNWSAYRSIMRSGYLPTFTIFSTGRQLEIKVSGNRGKTGPGFSATYKMVPAAVSHGKCNPEKNTTVHLTGEGMSFFTPKFPMYLGKGAACVWNITVSGGKFIKLTFWSFRASGCEKNYANVSEVTNGKQTFLEKFCNNQYRSDQVVYSSGHNLLISALFKKGGFVATFEAVSSIPGGDSCLNDDEIELSRSSGEFASYGFPNLYPNDAKCTWTITAPPGYLIQLTFNSFNLEPSQNCKKDFVKVVEGTLYIDNPGNTVLGTFCGSTLPGVIRSKYSTMYINFETDRAGMYRGFHASFITFPDPNVGPCKLDGFDNVIQMTGSKGEVFSPKFPPGTPPRDMMCTWTITVPERHFVRFNMILFKFDGDCGKWNTSLEIRDGGSSASNLLKLYCEYVFYGRELFSSGRQLWVRFKSSRADWSFLPRFRAVFEAVKQLPAPYSCVTDKRDFDLSSATGALASYNYPLPYDLPYTVDCTWTIKTGKLRKIQLWFDSFNLTDTNPECSHSDVVVVGDGDWSLGGTLIGKFCGSQMPPVINSNDSTMWVRFITTGKTKHPGFKASYKSVVSTQGILVILASCLGGVLLCLVIGIGCHRYCRSRRYRATCGDEILVIPLREEDVATEL